LWYCCVPFSVFWLTLTHLLLTPQPPASGAFPPFLPPPGLAGIPCGKSCVFPPAATLILLPPLLRLLFVYGLRGEVLRRFSPRSPRAGRSSIGRCRFPFSFPLFSLGSQVIRDRLNDFPRYSPFSLLPTIFVLSKHLFSFFWFWRMRVPPLPVRVFFQRSRDAYPFCAPPWTLRNGIFLSFMPRS